jgi:uncharacterized repeat protein (TIGR01451 family)
MSQKPVIEASAFDRGPSRDRNKNSSAKTAGVILLGLVACVGVLGTFSTAYGATEFPPSISKSFNPTKVPPNGTTTLTFTITNSNGFSFTAVAFTDTLPAGLTVATSTSTACAGTLTTTAPATISLTGASVGPGTCQFSVPVTVTVPGNYINTTSTITAANGGTGNFATTELDVVDPIPALGGWGLLTLAVLLGGVALWSLRPANA